MNFVQTDLLGLWIIDPVTHGDSRGFFRETFRLDLFEDHIGKVNFIQDNESRSVRGVLRGLHFQKGKFSQAKLVRVSEGEVLDVAVDLRFDSPTRGRYIAVRISAENGRQLFIPKGFAHGFFVLSPAAVFQYKVDAPYEPSAEMILKYDDPDIAVDWGLDGISPILSPKDLCGKSFKDLDYNLFI